MDISWDVLKNIPSALILFSLVSVLLSAFGSSLLTQPFSDLVIAASTDINEKMLDDAMEKSKTPVTLIREYEDLKGIMEGTRRKLLEKIQVEKLVSEKACELAHEMRTPLVAIRVFSKFLANYFLEIKSTHGDLDEINALPSLIEREVNNTSQVVDGFLKSMRDRYFDQSTFSFINLNDLIEESTSRYPFKSTVQKRLVTYMLETSPVFVWGDKQLLTHVVFNLIKNGLEQIERVQKGNIFLYIKQVNASISLIVRDTACTMRAEDKDRFFDRFISETEGGYGLGLSFCRRVVESFEAMIDCHVVVGEYTEFSITFPNGVEV